MILPRTIRDGEAAILWSPKGTRRIITGPSVIFAPFERMEMLPRRVARDGEFLVVHHADGTTEHIPGPCERWFDPLLHSRMDVERAIDLDSHEAVVIYREGKEGVRHCILRGPAVHVPEPNEWLHQFRWHADNGKGRKVPGALKFQKLRVIPDQMYFDVEGVRTSDEALVTVKLMVFFELMDIERMLASTHDPIADFINALTADVIQFACGSDFETFKSDAERLNDLRTYQELTTGAKRIGYRINKVVYRGYLAPGKLQQMHDNAIETRTRLLLESETEQRKQEVADLQQARDHERAARDREEEQRNLSHRLDLSRRTRLDELSGTREQEQLELELLTQKQEAEVVHRQRMIELQADEWLRLKDAGADLTAVLVAKERNPDKVIRLEQEASQGTGVHLHEAV
ncbi:hypothetical protein [Haloferula rosea]|uniref:Band 7 domain-containing protein n=1 Tax=Haloferula rosea TaxID=490093 RepID=A0A934RAL9_9BACT|nr:hypothetical protein [Haloferula rosea]MBK1828194.1 hypothetical protein [Haloferula rosea]